MQQRDDQHSRPQTGENQAPAQARTTTAPRRITPPNAPPHQHHAPEPTRLIRAWHEGLPMRRWIHVCQPSGAGTSGCWLVWVGSDACYWRCGALLGRGASLVRDWAAAYLVPVHGRLCWSSGCCPPAGDGLVVVGFMCVWGGGGLRVGPLFGVLGAGGGCGGFLFVIRVAVRPPRRGRGSPAASFRGWWSCSFGCLGSFSDGGAAWAFGGWCWPWPAQLVWSVAAWSGRLAPWSGLVAGCPRCCCYPSSLVLFQRITPRSADIGCTAVGWVAPPTPPWRWRTHGLPFLL